MAEENLLRLKERTEMHTALNDLLGSDTGHFPKLRHDLLGKAGLELYPIGVCIAVIQSIHTETADLEGVDHPYSNLLQYLTPSIIEAVIEGDATEAVTTWNNTVAEFEAQQPTVAPVIPVIDNAYFAAMQRLGHIFHEASRVSEMDYEDCRDDGLNSVYDQLEQGMIVEYYYSHPSKIHTPLGYFGILGSGGGTYEQREIFNFHFRNHPDIELELFEEMRVNSQGQYGPWYAVRRVGSYHLPTPVRRTKGQYVERVFANTIWDKLQNRYLGTHFIKSGQTVKVKLYPESKAAKPIAGQRVVIHRMNVGGYGMAEVSAPLSISPTRFHIIPATDLYLYKAGRIS